MHVEPILSIFDFSIGLEMRSLRTTRSPRGRTPRRDKRYAAEFNDCPYRWTFWAFLIFVDIREGGERGCHGGDRGRYRDRGRHVTLTNRLPIVIVESGWMRRGAEFSWWRLSEVEGSGLSRKGPLLTTK